MRVGDYVKLDSGEEGYVVAFSWRSTRVRMLSNNVIIVPNARLSQAIVTNYHLPSRDLAVLVDLGVDYASDLAHVERVTIEVARLHARYEQEGIVIPFPIRTLITKTPEAAGAPASRA